MSNPWALWRRRLIDNAQLAGAMQAKLAKGVAFMRHRSTRLLSLELDLIISQTTRQRTAVFKACLSKIFVSIASHGGDFGHIPGSTVWEVMDMIR